MFICYCIYVVFHDERVNSKSSLWLLRDFAKFSRVFVLIRRSARQIFGVSNVSVSDRKVSRGRRFGPCTLDYEDTGLRARNVDFERSESSRARDSSNENEGPPLSESLRRLAQSSLA